MHNILTFKMLSKCEGGGFFDIHFNGTKVQKNLPITKCLTSFFYTFFQH